MYTHDDWVKHRSPDRFIKNIMTTTKSGIYKNVGSEVAAVTAVATFAFLWNMVTGGYTDFAGVSHDPIISSSFLPTLTLPLTGFTLSSPFLGLLLGKQHLFLRKRHLRLDESQHSSFSFPHQLRVQALG